MNDARPPPRLFVAHDLAAGREVPATAGQRHYLRDVMRRRDGDAVALFNGRDGEWLAAVSHEARRRCLMVVRRRTRPQAPAPDLWLLFAPLKAAATAAVARMATELGVARLRPVITRRARAGRVASARLRANAVEAAEQCLRLDVPAVDPPEALDALLARWDPARRILLCAEAGAAEPAGAALARARPGGAWAVLAGPEGGFDPAELDTLRELPFVEPVRLGPRLLRADTAAAAALACWQSRLGDWTG